MTVLIRTFIAVFLILAAPAASNAQYLVAPGSVGNMLALDIDNTSDLLPFKGGNAEVLGWSGIIAAVNPLAQPISPSDLPPGGSGGVSLTFDVDPAAVPGQLGYIDLWLTSATGDSALVEVGLEAGAVTGAEDGATPRPAVLFQNYPNPFNPSTSIEFHLPRREQVSLRVYDVSGRLVRTIVEETLERGDYRFTWDGHNDRGATVASGVYFYMLKSDSISQARKAVLLR
jgi:hypothetical protein